MRLLTLICLIAPMLASPAALAVEAGDPAPGFSLPGLGTAQGAALDDFRGKVVWLDFWASWCPPCLVSIPRMSELRDRITATGAPFEVVAVNLDEDPADALDFLELDLDAPPSYVQLSDPAGDVAGLYALPAMPTAFLIDAQGRVRLVHEGFRESDLEDIEAAIEAALEEAP